MSQELYPADAFVGSSLVTSERLSKWPSRKRATKTRIPKVELHDGAVSAIRVYLGVGLER